MAEPRRLLVTRETTSSTSLSPPPNCAICLGTCSNKCFSDSCMHQFCFKCLLEWSKIKAECPLCKQSFKSIIHNVKSNNEYEEHIVESVVVDANPFVDGNTPFLYLSPTPPSPLHQFHFRTTLTVDTHGEHAIQQFLLSHPLTNRYSFNSIVSDSRYTHRRRNASSSTSSTFRRSIYNDNLWVYSPPDITGRYRDVSPQFYRDNPGSRTRLAPWLNRELNALLYENTQHVMHLVDVIMDQLTRHHICSSAFRRLLSYYLGNKTDHFVHEFYNFMRSPFDMIGYDRHVIYSNRPTSPTIPFIDVSDDDDDSDVILVSPSNNTTTNNNNVINLIDITTDSDEPIIVSTEDNSNLRDSSSVTMLVNNNNEEEGRRSPLLPLTLKYKKNRWHKSKERNNNTSKKRQKRQRSSSTSSSSSSSSSSMSTSSSRSSSKSSTTTSNSYVAPSTSRHKHTNKKRLKKHHHHRHRQHHNHHNSKRRIKTSRRKLLVPTETITTNVSVSDDDNNTNKSEVFNLVQVKSQLSDDDDDDDNVPLSNYANNNNNNKKISLKKIFVVKSESDYYDEGAASGSGVGNNNNTMMQHNKEKMDLFGSSPSSSSCSNNNNNNEDKIRFNSNIYGYAPPLVKSEIREVVHNNNNSSSSSNNNSKQCAAGPSNSVRNFIKYLQADNSQWYSRPCTLYNSDSSDN